VNEQALDLKSVFRLIWRRRWLVAALALVGFFFGVAYEVLTPPLPEARALVIIPSSSLTSSSGAVVDDTPTQIIIATSTPVLAAAGAVVSPPLSATALKSHVTVTALSDGVLQFQVTARRDSDAEKLANAEATSYIAFVNKTNAASTGGALPLLQNQASQLAKQVQDLQAQVNKASAQLATVGASSLEGQRDSSLISSLGTEQEEVSLQLNSVNNQILSAQLSGSLSANATRVLQSAAISPFSKTQLAMYPIGGALAGLLIGCLFAFFLSRRDRRLRLRDEIAGAIGVPVVASVTSTACRSAKDWSRLLQNYQTSPVDSWNVRRLLHGLPFMESEQGQQLNVIVFANDSAAIAGAVQLASSAAALGISVALVPGEHSSLTLLRAAMRLLGPAGGGDEAYCFEPRVGEPESSSRLTLRVDPVDEPKPELTGRAGRAVLAVSSGFATAEALARVALAASDTGHLVDGIIVVNPEPTDSTVGVLPATAERYQISRHPAHRPSTERSLGQLR
jgi:capsular polysaccharide biosynthesis protein